VPTGTKTIHILDSTCANRLPMSVIAYRLGRDGAPAFGIGSERR
jgi:hypothetical protein